MKSSTDDLSAETRSSFHSVKDMLARVSERLAALEAGGAQVAPLMASAATFEDEDIDVSDETLAMVEKAGDIDEPAFRTPSAPTEEEVMQRMREHVKSREPDAPVLLPDDDDMPTEPGSGRPIIEVEPEPAFENNRPPITQNDEVIAQFADCLLYTSPSPRDLSTSRMPSSA